MLLNLENKEIKLILQNSYIGHLGYVSNNKPCVVPIPYYFDKENNIIICYSGEGQKIDAMRKNNFVALEISDIESVGNWKSILIEGKFKELQGASAKSKLHTFFLGVKNILMTKENKDINSLREFSIKTNTNSAPVVFCIEIESITGIERKQKTFAL